MDIKNIVKFHREKFSKVDEKLQERKIWEEMAEFQTAISENEKGFGSVYGPRCVIL